MDHFYINWQTNENGYKPRDLLCEFFDFNSIEYSQMYDLHHFNNLVKDGNKTFIVDRDIFFKIIEDILQDIKKVELYKKNRYIVYHYVNGCPFHWMKHYKKISMMPEVHQAINSLSVNVLSDGHPGKILKDFFYGFSFHQIAFTWFHLFPYYHLGTLKQSNLTHDAKKDFLLLAFNKGDRVSRNILFSKLKDKNLLSNHFFYFSDKINPVLTPSKETESNIYEIPDLKHFSYFDKWLSNEVYKQSCYPVLDYYDRTNCEIICESYRGDTDSLSHDDSYHLTEKTIKPIVMGHPFIILNAPGSLKILQDLGFKTFSKYIDESYDKEIDLTRRIDKIIEAVDSIIKMGSKEFYESCYEERKHNFNHIYTIAGNYKKDIWNNLKKFFIKTANNA